MPSFCRHNRLIQNCPICAREQEVEMRPVLTPGGRPEPRPRPAGPARAAAPRRAAGATASRSSGRGSGGVTVRRLQRSAEDGYGCDLVPGVRSVADAERLADELAFAATRLTVLATDPPGLYADIADPSGDIEERIWLALQIALASPLPDGDPFAGIGSARRSWASGEPPAFADGETGPRGIADSSRADRVVAAYRAWVGRSGSQADGLSGEPSWTPARRFDRAFERLGALAGMDRAVRYDLLVTLGALGVAELAGERLHLGGGDAVTLAAKRILGIGDPLLLERRAADLASAAALPLSALDLGFFNWERGHRYTAGLAADAEPDRDAVDAARLALGL